MRAINNVDLEVGSSEIAISLYSAVEGETRFKQLSNCCNSAVNYRKICSECEKELSADQIHKALEVGDEYKNVDVEKTKLESGSLKVLGVLNGEEEEGVFKDGLVWFIGFKTDKNKAKTERTLIKYSYLRESLRTSEKSLICLIAVRGKEHIVLLKPYFDGFVGLGIYHFDRIRDIKELKGYSSAIELDKKIVINMSDNIKQKEKIYLKDIENTRERLIENAVLNKEVASEKPKLDNPIELVNF